MADGNEAGRVDDGSKLSTLGGKGQLLVVHLPELMQLREHGFPVLWGKELHLLGCPAKKLVPFIPCDLAKATIDFEIHAVSSTADGHSNQVGVKGFSKALFTLLKGGFSLFVLRDVGMDAHHADSTAMFIPGSCLALAQHPAPLAILRPYAEFGLKVVTPVFYAVHVGSNGGLPVFRVDVVHPEPDMGLDLGFCVAEHVRIGGIVVDLVSAHVPVPNTLLGACQGELPAQLALFDKVFGVHQVCDVKAKMDDFLDTS